ncbi:class I SAM-dependent methyltransferase [Cognatiluteimonas telluris]|uniref:class I SAM-dependent methyltransferase n=1 Tax=Cognatiluteimonas telluris TaxID=1104775 RepID=UPI00140B2BCF|nr:class I SAM-dependent methyltransferase [Lysobacter telluris]
MHPPPPVTFAAERLDLIAEGEAAHFWYGPRRALLLDTIAAAGLATGSRVLDVGCGTGGLVRALLERGYDARGIDPWALRSGLDPARHVVGQAEAVPAGDGSADAVCAFDVLEHADDGLALAEFARVLVPGGRLFVSVPAHAWLWSARDTLAGHRRRYSRRMLRRRVADAGFEVERIFGYQCLLLPLLAAARAMARLRGRDDTSAEDRPGPFVNAALLAINRSELVFGRVLRPPTGSSLVLVARRRSETRAVGGH